MKLFGFEITRTKTAVSPVTSPTGWDYNFGLPFWSSPATSAWPMIQEPFTGAWQRNQSLFYGGILVYHAIYRCITLISQDISKMRMRLMEQNETTGIWREVDRNSPYWPVLVKPNRYQNRIQFFDEWVGSKLIHGNTYVLKQRDQRGIVVALYILNPCRTKAKVAPDGAVYYDLQADDLAQVLETEVIDNQITVPATEIIHDRYKPLYHPLCGISPILACALSGALGMSIQLNSNKFFDNASRPGGVLSAPEHIGDDTAKRLKEHWEANYTGANAGRIAVLGDGLKYEPMRESNVNAQLIEQLKMTGENVCTAFGVPPYMIGIGEPPNYNNIEALNQQYYAQCLQNLIETIELLLDEGLGLTVIPQKVYGTEFDLGDLLRMDTATKSRTWGDMVKQGVAAPNEARAAFDLEPVNGGDSVYMQQQNFSLEALAKRDEQDDPFGTATKPPPATSSSANDNSEPQPTEDVTNVNNSFAERIRQYAQYQYRSAHAVR